MCAILNVQGRNSHLARGQLVFSLALSGSGSVIYVFVGCSGLGFLLVGSRESRLSIITIQYLAKLTRPISGFRLPLFHGGLSLTELITDQSYPEIQVIHRGSETPPSVLSYRTMTRYLHCMCRSLSASLKTFSCSRIFLSRIEPNQGSPRVVDRESPCFWQR